MDMFPPRREWHRFRPKHRENLAGDEVSLKALIRAVNCLRARTPQVAWAIARTTKFAGIRMRLGISPIQVRYAASSPGHEERRSVMSTVGLIAVFKLEDKVIEGLTARYLRTLVDRASSIRAWPFGRGTKTTHHRRYRTQQKGSCGSIVDTGVTASTSLSAT